MKLIKRNGSEVIFDRDKIAIAVRKANEGMHTVLDADTLEYISSAGLRIMLRLRKEEPKLAIINVAPDVYVAGAKIADGKLVTNGGRVLGVTACAPTLKEAISAAYAESEKVHFENAYKRSDIGQRALLAIK